MRSTSSLTLTRPALSSIHFLLIFSILVGAFIQFKVVEDKKVLEFDDAISILTATGHQGEYAQISENNSFPIGTWVPAKDWMRLIEHEAGRGLTQTAYDLANNDVHPPLYFWILSIWIYVFGSSLWSTNLLNLVIDLLIALTLVEVAYQIFHDRTAALLVCAIWILSPVSIKTTFWVRQYAFFSLIVLLYAYRVYKTFYSTVRVRLLDWSNLWLGLAALTGMLTHYYFAIFLLTSVVLIGNNYLNLRRDRRFLITMILVLLISGFLFITFLPNFYQSISFYFAKKFQLTASLPELSLRIRNAVKMGLLFLCPLLIMLGVWIGRTILRFGLGKLIRESKESIASLHTDPAFRWATAFTVLPFFMILVAYLTGVSQVHTFSSRYLGYLTPLAAFIPVFILQKFKDRDRLIPWTVLGMILLGFLTLVPGLGESQQGLVDRAALQDSKWVVVDSIQWGTWPGIIQILKDDQMVYVDSQERLSENPELWLDHLGSRGGLLVSIIRGEENTQQGRKRILDLAASRYKIEQLSEVSKPQDWDITLYRLTPAAALSR